MRKETRTKSRSLERRGNGEKKRQEGKRKLWVRHGKLELFMQKGRARLNEHPGARLPGSVGKELWNVEAGQSFSPIKSLRSGNWCRTQKEEGTATRRKGGLKERRQEAEEMGKSSFVSGRNRYTFGLGIARCPRREPKSPKRCNSLTVDLGQKGRTIKRL